MAKQARRSDMSTIRSGSSKPLRIAVTDDYLELVKRFPLRPLRSDADLKSAGRVLDELVGRADLSRGERDYMEGLVRFVRDYEAEYVRNRLKKLKPIELLKHLMQENRMNTTDLGYILGARLG
jgi:HTH-type transcriptional regulator/antitoxin HigA